jgi:hypothetical protein
MNTAKAPEVDPIGEAVQEMREQHRVAGETPERAKARTAAYAEARRQFPNQWAAMREVWDGARLVEPLVLAVSPTLGGLRTMLAEMPEGEKSGVELELLGPLLRYR